MFCHVRNKKPVSEQDNYINHQLQIYFKATVPAPLGKTGAQQELGQTPAAPQPNRGLPGDSPWFAGGIYAPGQQAGQAQQQQQQQPGQPPSFGPRADV